MRKLQLLAPLLALALAWLLAPREQGRGVRFRTSRPSEVRLALPESRDAFTFAVFGDRTGGPAEGVAVLAEAVAEVNLFAPDLVMTVGDLIEGYNTTEPWLAQMREYKQIMNRLEMPWFPVAGNHDVYWRGADRPPGEHEASYERHFGPLWYAFEHEGCWFVALYSDEGDPKSGRKSFSDPAHQRMSAEQFEWLAETLEAARRARHVFVFLHHPRWLGGGYGDDWERVHALLAASGNVKAVFAGHIHRMRYDGVRDGIEYFTLATVGGHQQGDMPEAGFLHHYELVTVGPKGIDVVSLPVGSAKDPRAITGAVSDQARALADDWRPSFERAVALDARLGAGGVLHARFENPADGQIEVTLSASSADSAWSFELDPPRFALAPGRSRRVAIAVARPRQAAAEDFDLPMLDVQADYLAGGLRVRVPHRSTPLPLDLSKLPLPDRRAPDLALELDGTAGHLRVEHETLDLPDGPLTLECWFQGRDFGGRRGLVAKTESCELGIFVSGGLPLFALHLDGRYVEPKASEPLLEPGRWHHVAGVFDGESVALFLDGRLIERLPGRGARTRRALPLIVGADVGGRGEANSHFDGRIDELRLSRVARYAKDFEPQRRLEGDKDTVLLLHMDGRVGPWTLDASPQRAHPVFAGGARLVPKE